MTYFKRLKPLYKKITRQYHVSLLGGSNQIGQTLSLLLRAQPKVTKLVIHDAQEQTPGVVLDLLHIPVESSLTGYFGDETCERAIKDADLIIVAGGATRQQGLLKKEWFSTNVSYVNMVASKIAKLQPMPFVGILTEPINTLVPMAAEILKSNGNYNPKKLFGITLIDTLRAQSLYAIESGLIPSDCKVPVIGGHSKNTILPLLSQTRPACNLLDESRIMDFTNKLRNCDDDVANAKKGCGSSLSIAYSGLMFTRKILDALDCVPTKVNTFVENNYFGTSFFSGLVNIDHDGAGDMQTYQNLSKFECHLLERSIEEIRKEVTQGKKILEIA